MKGALIWITGLAGSGKTTIATELCKRLQKTHTNVVHLDGDNMREILGGTYGHTIDDRRTTAMIYARLSHELVKQGMIVIVSTISLLHEVHDFNRTHTSAYYEILLQADETKLNDRRELYKKATNVMGVHQTPEFPKNPTLVLTNNDEEHIHENVDKILAVIGEKL